MSDPEQKNASPQKDWKDEILDIMVALEPDDEKSLGVFNLTEKTKPFIVNAVRESIRACYSQARVEKDMEITPYRVGAMVGHKWDIVRNLGKDIVPSRHLPQPKNPNEQEIYIMVQKCIELLEEFANSSREPTRRAVAEALFIALDQDARDTREFLDGFTKALNAGTLTKAGKLAGANARTALCIIVLQFGESLETRFKSVSDFHAWVEKTRGHNVAGSLERFQKFCNSIQLHFKKPGRPKTKTRK